MKKTAYDGISLSCIGEQQKRIYNAANAIGVDDAVKICPNLSNVEQLYNNKNNKFLISHKGTHIKGKTKQTRDFGDLDDACKQ